MEITTHTRSSARSSQANAPRVGFVSLGCPKALVDSERILTQLRTDGYDIAPDYAGADLVVVNTCGFIDAAKAESLDAIGEAVAENGKVVVTGCLGAQREEIESVHPGVLAITGPHQYEEVVSAVHQHLPAPEPTAFTSLTPSVRLTPRHYAYLKISEGCNHSCRFCIIPSMRGKLQSRPIDEVVAEARRLAMGGVKELLVISQDTSAYGVDTKYARRMVGGRMLQTRFFDLCEALGEIGIWVRLHYVYPYPHVDQVIPLMADGRILPYLDIPFQHGSPSVLRRMRRPAAAENTLERIARWRDLCPEIAIRSTFIVGYPGETEAEFEELLDWLRVARLDRVGCFEYSPVEGAAANQLPDPVPDDIKKARWNRFMEVAQEISAEKLSRRIGHEMQLLVDEVSSEGAIARTRFDAPEIDGVVHLPNASHLHPGQWITARIIDADAYDLQAQTVDTN